MSTVICWRLLSGGRCCSLDATDLPEGTTSRSMKHVFYMATFTLTWPSEKDALAWRSYVKKRLSDAGWNALEEELRRRDSNNSIRASVVRVQQILETTSAVRIVLVGRVTNAFRFLEGVRLAVWAVTAHSSGR
jgi:hypothetical protein